MRIEYTLQAHRPETHLFDVSLKLTEPPSGDIRIFLPTWIPGSYMIRDFSRHMTQLQAFDDKGPCACVLLDKNHWLCSPEGSLLLRYQIFAFDLTPRGAYLDNEQGFLNGARLFLQVEGFEQAPCSLEIRAPDSPAYADWQVATPMRPVRIDHNGYGLYESAHYAELIDHPIQMGSFDRVVFDVEGTPHHLIVTGQHRGDLARLAADLRTVCAYYAHLFRGLPFEHYYFFLSLLGEGYGGLEHRASSVLHFKRSGLPRSMDEALSDDSIDLLSLASHEYFHAWNVKRIKPLALVSPDLNQETYTRQLWLFEGITAYYDQLTLLRTGLISLPQYLKRLEDDLNRYDQTPGRYAQTLEEASLEAWTKFYKPDENGVNSSVSYYLKGSLVALCLDLTLRLETEDVNLDVIMQALWQQYGKVGFGLPEGGFEHLCKQVSGINLEGFFARCLRSVEELPLTDLLQAFDIQMSRVESSAAKASLICKLKSDLTLQSIPQNSPMQQAGLCPQDVLVALDGIKLEKSRLDALLAQYQPGARVRIHAFRGDQLKSFDVILSESPGRYRLSADKPNQERSVWSQA